MSKSALLLAFAGLLLCLTPALGKADDRCDVQEEKVCDARRFSWCGPISIRFWTSDKGTRHCERASISLSATDVLPNLRLMRCYFYGEDTSVRFDSDNYETVTGPTAGDLVPIRNGVGEVMLRGRYFNMNKEPQVFFENVGPGTSVIMKCNGYGPG